MVMNKYDKAHMQNLVAIERQIEAIYQSAIREAARLGVSLGAINPDKVFSFTDYPVTKGRVDKLLQGLKNRLYTCIVNGINAEWTLSNNKNNELARQVFGDNVGKLSQQQYRLYFSTNDEARKAFIQRKTNGLKLSDRVWNYTTGFQREIELGLDVGIRNGMSAADMTKELGLFLKHPDKLFRRVRDEHGNLNPSKRASEFHPGRGVYRSSYMNARRLAATETNIAYRTSDYLRWQDMDFVVGIRVVMSNNHTCLGRDGKPHPFTDICDELSAPLNFDKNSKKGCYPKDFKFTGWHPHCRCHVLSILKTAEEMAEDDKRIDRGEELRCESVNKVTEPPKEFTAWLKANQQRAETSYSVPYFMLDNVGKYVPIEMVQAFTSKMPYKTYAEYEQALRWNEKNGGFSDEIIANNKELESLLPVLQGRQMAFGEADKAHPNPHYTDENARAKGYCHNCQTCTVAYELRRRGFNVSAMQNIMTTNGNRRVDNFFAEQKMTWEERFLNADGSKPQYSWSGTGVSDTAEAKLKFIENQTQKTGRYEIYVAWDKENAHVFTVERQKNGKLRWYDPQSARRDFRNDALKRMRNDLIGVLRIDDKIINPKFASRLRKSVE